MQDQLDFRTEQVTQMESELEIVKWYVEFMEDNMDTRQLKQAYVKLRADYD